SVSTRVSVATNAPTGPACAMVMHTAPSVPARVVAVEHRGLAVALPAPDLGLQFVHELRAVRGRRVDGDGVGVATDDAAGYGPGATPAGAGHAGERNANAVAVVA